MIILAIDPGPLESAYVVWDGERIREKGKLQNDEMREWLLAYLQLRIRVTGIPPLLWIEMIASYGMPVGAEVFETCVWIGRFMEGWWNYGGGLTYRLKRKEIVMHLCGSARAKDANVRQALLDRVGPQGTKKEPGPTYGVSGDIWAALAVAVTAWDKLHEPNGAGNPS